MATLRIPLRRNRMQPVQQPQRLHGASKRTQSILRYLFVGVAAFIAIFPLYWIVVTSLLTPQHALDVVPHFLPDWQWSNYLHVWQQQPWGRFFLNSLFVSLCTATLALLTSLLAGYAFGTMKFPGRTVLFLLILGLIMIPGEATLIPSYLIVTKVLDWSDTYQAQIIPFAVSISGIFLLRQFFLALPTSLWEAAQLDGCSRFGFLRRVAAPLAGPALAVIALQVFIGSWNAFLWPYLVAKSQAMLPIEVGLQALLSGEGGTDPTGLAAAATFTTLPVLVLFLIAQRQFIEGISAGSTKG